MEEAFKSVLGVEVNNPRVCIKGNGHFACICPECKKEMAQKINEFLTHDKQI